MLYRFRCAFYDHLVDQVVHLWIAGQQCAKIVAVKRQQTALLAAAKATEENAWASAEAVLAEAYTTLQANGARLITPAPPALHRDLEAASQHVFDSWKQKVSRQDGNLLEEYLESRPER